MTEPQEKRAQERPDGGDGAPPAVSDIDRLTGEVEEANRRADEYLALLQRERAEFSNYRRRTAEERERDLGLAGEDLIRKVLALADDFDRAIDARPPELTTDPWAEGIVAIDRKLRALLESEGVAPIEASPGTRFDPREHDAVANVPNTGRREGEIVDEVRRGYRLRDRVLRPSLVAVAAGGEAATEAADRDASATPEPRQPEPRND
jgi:molecular chaperone GrpE